MQDTAHLCLGWWRVRCRLGSPGSKADPRQLWAGHTITPLTGGGEFVVPAVLVTLLPVIWPIDKSHDYDKGCSETGNDNPCYGTATEPEGDGRAWRKGEEEGRGGERGGEEGEGGRGGEKRRGEGGRGGSWW